MTKVLLFFSLSI